MRPPRAPLAELWQAAEQVTRDYETFLRAGPGPGGREDAKTFAAHHAACRSALAHLEHLLKLTRAAPADEPDVPDAASLVEAARAGIAATEDSAHDDED